MTTCNRIGYGPNRRFILEVGCACAPTLCALSLWERATPPGMEAVDRVGNTRSRVRGAHGIACGDTNGIDAARRAACGLLSCRDKKVTKDLTQARIPARARHSYFPVHQTPTRSLRRTSCRQLRCAILLRLKPGCAIPGAPARRQDSPLDCPEDPASPYAPRLSRASRAVQGRTNAA